MVNWLNVMISRAAHPSPDCTEDTARQSCGAAREPALALGDSDDSNGVGIVLMVNGNGKNGDKD